LNALEEIGADLFIRESGLTILFDSGVRTGSDILKALALGAKAVLIGRPYIYGLAISGEEGGQARAELRYRRHGQFAHQSGKKKRGRSESHGSAGFSHSVHAVQCQSMLFKLQCDCELAVC